MGINRSWVTSHTGLPAFYVTGTGRLTADSPVLGEAMPRLVARVDGEALVADPGAAVGLPTTYRFGSESVTLTRRGSGGVSGVDRHQFVTDVSGQVVADVVLVGDDGRDYDTASEVFTSALGSQIPRYSLGIPPQSGTLEFLTTLAGTRTLREFTRVRSPLWVAHNAAACELPGCDIEGSRLVVPTRMRESRTARRDVAQRAWSIDYLRVPDELASGGVERATGGPVVTWGQWASWGKSNGPAGWQAWSALQVATRIAGMPV